MIYVERSDIAEPSALRTSRALEAQAAVYKFFGESDQKQRKQKRAWSDAAVYRGALSDLQRLFHKKCAYCESIVEQGYIEHFRPQGGVGGSFKDAHLYYSWLAYAWDNLLLSCQTCNAKKANWFPMRGAPAPVLSSVATCREVEVDTLVDPTFDDPSEHLVFNSDGTVSGLSESGCSTIEVIALNRAHLVAERLRVTTEVDFFLTRLGSAEAKQITPTDELRALARLTSAYSPYAAAARAALLAGLDRVSPRLRGGLSQFVRPGKPRNVKIQRRPVRPRQVDFVVRQIAGRAELPVRVTSQLRAINITNFRAIEQVNIELTPSELAQGPTTSALVLLGENSVGKSSVLEAIGLALIGTDELRRLRIDGKRYLRQDSSWLPTYNDALIKLYFDDEVEPSVTLRINGLTGEFEGPTAQQSVVIGYGPRRWFEDRKQRRLKAPGERLRSLLQSNTRLSDPIPWLRRASESDFTATARALRSVLLLSNDAMLERPSENLDEEEVTIVLHENRTPISRTSEGYRSVVAMTIDIIREMLYYWPNLESAQGVVLIDEIDAHLHPRWKLLILRQLRQAMPRVQFICTTHDPLCLRGAYGGEVQVLQRVNGQIRTIEDLPDVTSLSVEQLLTSEFFGLLTTEDPESERDTIRHAQLIAQPMRTQSEEEELVLLREKLGKGLRLGPNAQSAVLYDATTTFLAERRTAEPQQRRALSQQAARQLLSIWQSSSADEEPGS